PECRLTVLVALRLSFLANLPEIPLVVVEARDVVVLLLGCESAKGTDAVARGIHHDGPVDRESRPRAFEAVLDLLEQAEHVLAQRRVSRVGLEVDRPPMTIMDEHLLEAAHDSPQPPHLVLPTRLGGTQGLRVSAALADPK